MFNYFRKKPNPPDLKTQSVPSSKHHIGYENQSLNVVNSMFFLRYIRKMKIYCGQNEEVLGAFANYEMGLFASSCPSSVLPHKTTRFPLDE
jgi:hypothetical protein